MSESNRREKAILEIVAAAQHEDAPFIDTTLSDEGTASQFLKWAFDEGLGSRDERLRNLAAIIIHQCSRKFSSSQQKIIDRAIQIDPSMHVRYRLAIGMIRRGYRSEMLSELWREASKLPEFKKLTQKFKPTTPKKHT